MYEECRGEHMLLDLILVTLKQPLYYFPVMML